MSETLPETVLDRPEIDTGRFWRDTRRVKAADMLASGRTWAEVETECGRSHGWLLHLNANPIFRARIAEIIEEERQAVLSTGIADKVWRMRELRKMYDAVDELQTTRGLITTETRTFGETTVETEYFAEGLIRQKRGLLDDAAKEMGERKQLQVNNDNRTFNYVELVGQLE